MIRNHQHMRAAAKSLGEWPQTLRDEVGSEWQLWSLGPKGGAWYARVLLGSAEFRAAYREKARGNFRLERVDALRPTKPYATVEEWREAELARAAELRAHDYNAYSNLKRRFGPSDWLGGQHPLVADEGIKW